MIHGQQIWGGGCFKVEYIIYQHYLPPIKSVISPCAYLQLKINLKMLFLETLYPEDMLNEIDNATKLKGTSGWAECIQA